MGCEVGLGSCSGVGALSITKWCGWDLKSPCMEVRSAAVAMVYERVLDLGVPGTGTVFPCGAA